MVMRRRALAILCFVAAGLSAGCATPAMDLAPRAGLAIQVRQGDWGTAQPSDIQAVLESVAAVLEPYFPQRAARVEVAFGSDGPRVLLASSDRAHLVLLNVQDRRWDQFAYQFAHELCHILAGYEQRLAGTDTDAGGHQWFEEAVCDMASLFTLDGMALRWEQSPPFDHWRDYASAFRDYRERLLAAPPRQLPPDRTISDWYIENRVELEANPYLWDMNGLVAGQLLLLLDDVPGAMETLAYLNAGNSASEASFAAYLASWRSRCPEEKRAFVNRVILLFDAERGAG